MAHKNIDEFAIKAKAESDWKTSPAIREEFSTEEVYFNFLRAEAAGLVKMAPSTIR